MLVKRSCAASFAVVVALVAGAATAAAQTPFTHRGIDPLHPGSSHLPIEQVDPASGNLTIVATDLVLPGNGGFDLRIQRVYNSSVFPDYDGEGNTALEEDSWAGIGWKLHFGRVLNPYATQGGETQIEMGDGSRHALYTAAGGGWITTGFWRYDKSTHTLQVPNGLVYVFGREVFINARLGTVRYVTEIRDPFNNRLTFTYFDGNGPPDGVERIEQHLGAGQVRTVTFGYDATLKGLSSMSYNGRTWTYQHQAAGPPGFSVLTGVSPPGGPGSGYEYASLTGELTKLLMPAGGFVAYTYGDAARRAGPLTMLTRVVTTRTTGGFRISPGTWTYSYGTGSNQDTTVVDCPCGTTRYRFYGTGVSGDFTGWSAGTLVELTVEESSTVLERRTMAWARSDQISSDPVPGVGGVWVDSAVYKPLLVDTVITRGSQTWTLSNDYATGTYNDFGQPWRIREVGETPYQTRTTTRSFRYGFGPYLAPQVSLETTVVRTGYSEFADPIERSWTHDLATGFITSQRIFGLVTTFEPTAQGNVAAIIDARGNRTTLSYSWGVVSDTQTPNTRVTATITSDGLATSVTNHVDTPTTLIYDDLFRIQSIQRAGATTIQYEYDSQWGRLVRVRRGTAFTEYHLNGFSQAVETFNSVGLRTHEQDDACGRVLFHYEPWTQGTPSRRTTFQYDALGRVTRVTDPVGAVTDFLYTGVDITRIDPESRSTFFDDLAFSGPGSERLMSVRDAAGVTTSYAHDGHGNLTRVTGPSAGLTRTWTRNEAGQVLSETQPESGTTTYAYDVAGNLTSRTDANGQTTTYTYDTDNRLVTRNAPGTSDDLTITYHASGRVQSLSGGGATTSYTYDSLGRLTQRTDTVGALSFASQYAYNADDDLTSLTYPSGRVVAYEYGDSEHRLTAVRQNGALFAQGFTYDDAGRLVGYTTGAVTHNFTYDNANRAQRILATGSGATLDLTYTYDQVGNVRTIADPRPGASQTFTLDPLDRLTTADGPWGQLNWSYDAAGNRLTQGGAMPVTYTYQASTQRLTSSSGAMAESFTYNAVGQLTGDGRGTYTYSPLGRLATTTSTGLSASYTYDAAGLRLGKTVNGHTTYTVRSASGEVLSEYSAPCATPVWSKDTIYALGRVLGAVRSTAPVATVSVSSSAVSVGESAGSVNVSFVVSTPGGGPLPCAVTAAYDAKPGTASAASDFTPKSGTVTFPAGSPNNATQSTSILVTADSLDEANETFFVDLSSATGGTLGTSARTTVTILDDDATPTLSVNDVTLYEGQSGTSNATFTVTLSAVSGQSVQVSYATSNGTATAGVDYQFSTGSLTIPAGMSSGAITVPIFGDTAVEPNETFLLTLSSPVNATLADGQGTGTILNDDAARNTWGDFYEPRDGAADAAVFNLGSGQWIVKDSNTGTVTTLTPFGVALNAQDIFVPADYTGDGKTDCAAYRPGTGQWFIAPSCESAGGYTVTWGGDPSDVPVPADYDGDGRVDVAVYRRATTFWYGLYSSGGSFAVEWGWTWTQVIPTPGDYNGDGRADFAYYAVTNSSWWVYFNGGGVYALDGYLPGAVVTVAPGDYDGDGRTDYAYFYAPGAYWYIVPSSTGVPYTTYFGTGAMTPVAADYDGDGKTDIALYEDAGTYRVFWVLRSTTGTMMSIEMTAVSPAGAVPVLRRPQ
jgi:YD repeat-containing protein